MTFYDVEDEDGIYDIVLIYQRASGANNNGSTDSGSTASADTIYVTSGASFNCTGASIEMGDVLYVKEVRTAAGKVLSADAPADYTLGVH